MVEAKKLAKHLSPLGYIWRRTFLRPEKHMLFFKGPESKRTHYLHVMKYDGRIWKNDVLFRNSLRRSPARAKEYEAIKITLAKKFFSQRGSYTKGKERFIRQTLKMAER